MKDIFGSVMLYKSRSAVMSEKFIITESQWYV